MRVSSPKRTFCVCGLIRRKVLYNIYWRKEISFANRFRNEIFVWLKKRESWEWKNISKSLVLDLLNASIILLFYRHLYILTINRYIEIPNTLRLGTGYMNTTIYFPIFSANFTTKSEGGKSFCKVACQSGGINSDKYSFYDAWWIFWGIESFWG